MFCLCHCQYRFHCKVIYIYIPQIRHSAVDGSRNRWVYYLYFFFRLIVSRLPELKDLNLPCLSLLSITLRVIFCLLGYSRTLTDTKLLRGWVELVGYSRRLIMLIPTISNNSQWASVSSIRIILYTGHTIT